MAAIVTLIANLITTKQAPLIHIPKPLAQLQIKVTHL